VPTSTPWGPAQTARKIANGIMVYSTARHGGYHLSPTRAAQVPASIRSFAGGAWFEEDCDWAVVCLVFPREFCAAIPADRATPAEVIQAARNILERYNPAWLAAIEQRPVEV
jgi:hypothetical protein